MSPVDVVSLERRGCFDLQDPLSKIGRFLLLSHSIWLLLSITRLSRTCQLDLNGGPARSQVQCLSFSNLDNCNQRFLISSFSTRGVNRQSRCGSSSPSSPSSPSPTPSSAASSMACSTAVVAAGMADTADTLTSRISATTPATQHTTASASTNVSDIRNCPFPGLSTPSPHPGFQVPDKSARL